MEFQCTVEAVADLSPSVFELKFSTQQPLRFEAGQYVSVVVPHAPKPLRRPYSIASAPGQDPIELCIQRIEKGPGNTYLAGLKKGDTFTCFAPYGYLLYHPKPGRDAYFIATGTGIAPFRAMLLSEAYREQPPRRATCLLGVKTQNEVLYSRELSAVSGLNWVPCISRQETCEPGQCLGRVTQYLQGHSEKILWGETDFYLCGNGAMIDEVKTILKTHGVPKAAIYQEVYFKPELKS